MSRQQLELAEGLSLPVDAVTQTFCVFGKRESGKSNTCVRMAEQFFKAGVQFVAIDPVDNWWGLKSSKDGNSPGLGVYIFGGKHQDAPLESTSGALMADVLIETRISAILSIRHFSIRQRSTFVSEFAARLFERNEGEPLHVFLEESHTVAPQQILKGEGQEMMVHRVAKLWTEGRTSGLGGSAITQRPALLNTTIRTQAEILILHRVIGPHDAAAIREWIKHHGESEEVLEQLGGLAAGEAFVWAPAFPPEKPIGLQRVRMLRRDTFDSGATPKFGEKVRQPKALAAVDLAEITERIAATVERTNASDPVTLQARVRELELENAALEELVAAAEAREPERIEVPGLHNEDLTAVIAAEQSLAAAEDTIRGALLDLRSLLSRPLASIESAPLSPRSFTQVLPEQLESRVGKVISRLANEAGAPARRPELGNGAAREIGGGAHRMLGELRRFHPVALTRSQLATLAEMSPRSSTWRNNLSALRSRGLVVTEGDTVVLTPQGCEAVEVLPQPRGAAELIELWKRKLPGGAQRMLDVLYKVPKGVTREELALQSGMSITSSTFRNNLSALRANGLAATRGQHVGIADTFWLLAKPHRRS